MQTSKPCRFKFDLKRLPEQLVGTACILHEPQQQPGCSPQAMAAYSMAPAGLRPIACEAGAHTCSAYKAA